MEKDYEHKAITLIKTIQANVDNASLDDRSFRTFIRNSLKIFPNYFFKNSEDKDNT